MSGFRRVKRGKWWSYELDGKRLPSVTTLISKGVPKPNLIDWAARAAAEWAADNVDDNSRLDRGPAVDVIKSAHSRSRNLAAAKGTDIHGIAQALAEVQVVDIPDTVAGYVDAYLAFLGDWQPDVVALEAAIVSKRWRYAGTFDLVAWLRAIHPDRPVLIDIKTGGSGVWPETCLQLAAYRHAEFYLDPAGNEQPMPATAGGYALWLGDDGTYELLPVQSDDDIFAAFLHAAHVATFCGREKDDLIGLPLPAPVVA